MDSLKERIHSFEEKTGCELVFHFRRKLGREPVKKNVQLFEKFNLHRTTGRRAILVTLALTERQFAVWADEGVAKYTGEKLWNQITAHLSQKLSKGEKLKGLMEVVDIAETLLKGIPPTLNPDHINEISDEPIIDDED